MSAKPEHSDSVRACREMVADLIVGCEQSIDTLPEEKRLRGILERAEQRISGLRSTQPGWERKEQRSRALYDGAGRKVSPIYTQRIEFQRKAKTKFDELSVILGDNEVERRSGKVDWSDLYSILRGLRSAEKALAEYRQGRPDQSPAPVGEARAARSTASRLANDPLAEVKDIVKRMWADGSTYQEICAVLGKMPRPEGARWKYLSWPDAFKSPKYHGAVLTMLCKIAHR